MYNQFR